MSIERVRAEFEKFGIAERMLEFSVSSATVELAAKAVVPRARTSASARKSVDMRLNFM